MLPHCTTSRSTYCRVARQQPIPFLPHVWYFRTDSAIDCSGSLPWSLNPSTAVISPRGSAGVRTRLRLHAQRQHVLGHPAVRMLYIGQPLWILSASVVLCGYYLPERFASMSWQPVPPVQDVAVRASCQVVSCRAETVGPRCLIANLFASCLHSSPSPNPPLEPPAEI